MLSNQQRSRNITTDTAVQSVFVMLQHLHPELHHYMQLLEDKRGKLSNEFFKQKTKIIFLFSIF